LQRLQLNSQSEIEEADARWALARLHLRSAADKLVPWPSVGRTAATNRRHELRNLSPCHKVVRKSARVFRASPLHHSGACWWRAILTTCINVEDLPRAQLIFNPGISVGFGTDGGKRPQQCKLRPSTQHSRPANANQQSVPKNERP